MGSTIVEQSCRTASQNSFGIQTQVKFLILFCISFPLGNLWDWDHHIYSIFILWQSNTQESQSWSRPMLHTSVVFLSTCRAHVNSTIICIEVIPGNLNHGSPWYPKNRKQPVRVNSNWQVSLPQYFITIIINPTNIIAKQVCLAPAILPI